MLNLLRSHQQVTNTSYVFITHDLGVVRYLSDDILVLYAGHVAESGPANKVLSTPSHPYTEALMSAAPVPDPDAQPTTIRLPGFVPTMRAQFQGCFFAGALPSKDRTRMRRNPTTRAYFRRWRSRDLLPYSSGGAVPAAS